MAPSLTVKDRRLQFHYKSEFLGPDSCKDYSPYMIKFPFMFYLNVIFNSFTGIYLGMNGYLTTSIHIYK